MLIGHFTNLRLTQVSRRGERFDYWVSDGDVEFCLEIRGTLNQNLKRRHRQKTSQLLENPNGIDGYVAVVHFVNREAILSFHPQNAAT